ncbi:MAG: ComF family protein [Fibrobacteres bacterium]|nr:ComF family protein [Fibrobacterota bacterium]
MNVPVIGRLARWGREFLLPPVCCGCGREASAGGVLCGMCREHSHRARSIPLCPAGLESIACGPEVVPPVRALVHALKYSGVRKAAQELVAIADQCVGEDFFPQGSVLVPIPLHPHRQRERGYNQSELLARQWANLRGVRMERDWVRRIRETGTQTRLSASERAANLTGAFEPTDRFQPGLPIVLVDDVLTTGSTLSACASGLLARGASSVRGLCVAWAGEA